MWKEDSTPLLSVCTLAYNHEKYIRQMLDGALMQKTDFPIEIIIHDDSSTDKTADIIRQYEKEYPDVVKPIYQTKNQWPSMGWGILTQFVYPKAKGKYIALCEGDDFWTDPEKLQKQVNYLEMHPECSATYHSVNYVRGEKIIKNDRSSNSERDVKTEEVIDEGGLFIATASLVFRAEYAMNFPRFVNMTQIADYPLQILLTLRGRVHYFPDIMGAYRIGHEESWCTAMAKVNRLSKQKLDFFQNEIEWLREFDAETKGIYADSVYYRVGQYMRDLYIAGRVPFSELTENLSKISLRRAPKKKLSMARKFYERRIRMFLQGK